MTNGDLGYAPDWYFTLRAADRCHTSVLELEKPENKEWIQRAIVANNAEQKAQRAKDTHNAWRRSQGLPEV